MDPSEKIEQIIDNLANIKPSAVTRWDSAPKVPLYSKADLVAAIRTAPELEQLQRRATELMAELARRYAAILDAAATLLLAHGCRDIARVLQPNGVDELWVDATADRQRVGEVMPGRCVYRQWMSYEDGKVSVAAEWLDPEMAKSRRDLILATVDDAVSDLLYYNRKEDEGLPPGSIEDAIATGEISVDEMVEVFRAALVKGLVS